MRVLVCGDRDWTDAATMKRVLSRYEGSPTTIVHGAARGADMLAERLADALHLATDQFPANWSKHGPAAGPIRNRAMLDSGVDRVIAFHDNLTASKGTRDCVNEARRRGIPVEVVASAARRPSSGAPDDAAPDTGRA